ncbi:MAG: DUF6268 family outer membrane beta-barrel protein [Akkermansiaceae bacterium]|jgi:hypothetical protein|nr:DUF6268 family outer membrane beta-barrel protein [Akkermansiaceae bacterium]
MIPHSLLALSLVATAATAETLDLGRLVPAGSARFESTFGLDFEGPTPGEVDMSTLSFFTRLDSVMLGEGLQWLPTFSYEATSFDFDARPFGLAPGAPDLEDPMHRISFANYFLYQPDDCWFHGLMVSPEIRSSFDHLNSRDFSLSAAFGSGYRFSERLIVGFGIYAEDITNDPWLIAGPAFLWNPSERWSVSFFGPRFTARRHFSADSNLAFEAGWNGGQWSVDAFGQDAKLDLDSTRAGLVYRHRIHDGWWLEAAAGMTFSNDLRVMSAGGRDLFPAVMGETGAAPYVRVGVSLMNW